MPDFRPDQPKGFDLDRCWKNRHSFGGTFQGRCSKPVDPTDDLGLCRDHIDELRDLNEGLPEIHTKELDVDAVLC